MNPVTWIVWATIVIYLLNLLLDSKNDVTISPNCFRGFENLDRESEEIFKVL